MFALIRFTKRQPGISFIVVSSSRVVKRYSFKDIFRSDGHKLNVTHHINKCCSMYVCTCHIGVKLHILKNIKFIIVVHVAGQLKEA